MTRRDSHAHILFASLMLALLIAMVAACRVLGAPQSPNVHPAKPELYIIHSDACPPCRNFDDVYDHHAQLRQTLRAAFHLRSLDWDIPAQQAIARSWGVTAVPTFVVRRNGQIRFVHVGFTSSKKPEAVAEAINSLMDGIRVEWPPAQPTAPVPAPGPVQAPAPVPADKRPAAGQSPPAADEVAREAISQLASQSRELKTGQARTEQKVEALQADVQTIRGDITQLNTEITQSTSSVRDHVESTSRTLQETMERHMKSIFDESTTPAPPAAAPPIVLSPVGENVAVRPDEGLPDPQAAPVHHTASKWLQVARWAGRTGLAIAAPEVFLPGGIALAIAGAGLQWWRRRRQPKPLGTIDNPIRVTDPTTVKTETKFVVHESDILGESYREAIRRVGNAHRENSPEVIDVLKQVDAAATQIAHGRRVVRRPAIAPASENAP